MTAAVREIPLTRIWSAGLLALCAVVGYIAGFDPKLAIGAAVAAIFVLLAFSNLAVALAIFCVEPLDLDFSSSKVVRIGALLLVLAWVGALASRRRTSRSIFTVAPALCWSLAGLMAWIVLSITWAEDPTAALIQTGGYAMGAAILLIAFTAVRKREELSYVFGIVVLGIIGTGFYAFVAPPEEEALAASGRLSGAVDPNVLAAILISGAIISIGVAALWKKRSPGLRLAAGAGGLFCLAAVFLTVSRGGLVALGAAMFAGVVFGGRWRGRVAFAATVVALGSFYYITALAPVEARERILNTVAGQDTLLEGRTTIWKVALRMGEANPVHGVGAGNFRISAKHYLLEPGELPRSDLIIDTPKVAHNVYLQILAELGIVGLVLFLLVVFFALRSMLLAARAFRKREDVPAEILARALLVGTIGMLTAAFFISIELDKHLWLLLGLGPALLHIAQMRGRSDTDSAVA